MSELERLAARAGDLPALPQVAMKVIEVASDVDSSIRDLEAAVARDQAIASTVLRLSNSAYYGMPGRISTLSRAVLVIGSDKLKSVVYAACTESLFRKSKSSFEDRILWEHSLATAIVGRFLSKRLGHPSGEESLVAGLIHDIGKVIMDTNARDKYQWVLQRVKNEHETFVAAEREVFGFDHADVGGLVARKWSLADNLVEAVRCHHNPSAATVDPKLSAIINLANGICVKLEIGPERLPDLDLASLPSCDILALDRETLDCLPEEALACLELERQSLAVG
jgi:putative nucleotidyltransferase with HDIG domain